MKLKWNTSNFEEELLLFGFCFCCIFVIVREHHITIAQLHAKTSIPEIHNIIHSRQLRLLSRIATSPPTSLLRMAVSSQGWKTENTRYSTKKTTRMAWKDALTASRLFDSNQKISTHDWIECLKHPLTPIRIENGLHLKRGSFRKLRIDEAS